MGGGPEFNVAEKHLAGSSKCPCSPCTNCLTPEEEKSLAHRKPEFRLFILRTMTPNAAYGLLDLCEGHFLDSRVERMWESWKAAVELCENANTRGTTEFNWEHQPL